MGVLKGTLRVLGGGGGPKKDPWGLPGVFVGPKGNPGGLWGLQGGPKGGTEGPEGTSGVFGVLRGGARGPPGVLDGSVGVATRGGAGRCVAPPT